MKGSWHHYMSKSIIMINCRILNSCSLVFTCVHLCSTRVLLVFARARLCSFCLYLCFHSCSLASYLCPLGSACALPVFICVLLMFYLCSFYPWSSCILHLVYLCSTWVHLCSALVLLVFNRVLTHVFLYHRSSISNTS